ncbi:hypothetical protein SAMN05444388_109164 [Flavobacterium johnsoniae]|uniref:Uncharacterized protein n=1 Tax=Flavobacterium johnsoniae TaxID=986 RepID=A0A1M5S8X9_FLAJO|nr:hypothetical protein SAMN05444388_109164 [Flavobacterium johnsoniae]
MINSQEGRITLVYFSWKEHIVVITFYIESKLISQIIV